MTVLKLGFDTHSPTFQPVPTRQREISDSSAAQTGSAKGVEASVEDVDVVTATFRPDDDGAKIKDKAKELEERLAGLDNGVGGNGLAMIDELMGIYVFQAQMAAATGNVETAELVAQMAGGMVGRAQNAVVGLRDGISAKAAGDPAAVQQGYAELSRTVQRIAMRARSVASIAAAAAREASSASQQIGNGAPGTSSTARIESAVASLVASMFSDGRPAVVDAGGSGKPSGSHGKPPSVILSTEA